MELFFDLDALDPVSRAQFQELCACASCGSQAQALQPAIPRVPPAPASHSFPTLAPNGQPTNSYPPPLHSSPMSVPPSALNLHLPFFTPRNDGPPPSLTAPPPSGTLPHTGPIPSGQLTHSQAERQMATAVRNGHVNVRLLRSYFNSMAHHSSIGSWTVGKRAVSAANPSVCC